MSEPALVSVKRGRGGGGWRKRESRWNGENAITVVGNGPRPVPHCPLLPPRSTEKAPPQPSPEDGASPCPASVRPAALGWTWRQAHWAVGSQSSPCTHATTISWMPAACAGASSTGDRLTGLVQGGSAFPARKSRLERSPGLSSPPGHLDTERPSPSLAFWAGAAVALTLHPSWEPDLTCVSLLPCGVVAVWPPLQNVCVHQR